MCEYVSVYASYLTVINKHELGDIKLAEAHTIFEVKECVHVYMFVDMYVKEFCM